MSIDVWMRMRMIYLTGEQDSINVYQKEIILLVKTVTLTPMNRYILMIAVRSESQFFGS